MRTHLDAPRGRRWYAFGVIVLAIAVAGIWIAPGSTRAAADGQLEAIVGTNDGFDITLNDANGNKVARLAPGTYTIVVHDRSALHNFHMASNTDPTVDFRTGIEFVGDETFTVTFKPGLRYAYACEPHFQVDERRVQDRRAADDYAGAADAAEARDARRSCHRRRQSVARAGERQARHRAHRRA